MKNNVTEIYLTVADIRAFLNVSQSQAYALAHSKGFPVCHFGSSIRIPRGPFLNWVAQHSSVPENLSA